MTQLRKVGTVATSVRGDGDNSLVVRYHATDVVAVRGDNVTLDSGGWQTATTKVRMNQAANQYGLGFSVYQEKHTWYVRLPDGHIVEFYDGITFKRA